MHKFNKGILKINNPALLLMALGMWLPVFALAQLPTLTTTITKDRLLIGEQSTLNIKANFPNNGYTVNWFKLPDSLSHFEVVEASKIDTSLNNGLTQLQQRLVFTSFDSGQWTTPPLAIEFHPQGAGSNALTLYTDSMPYQVRFVTDTTTEIRDVKPIIAEELSDGWPWYYWVGGGLLLLLLLLGLGWLLYRYLNKKTPVFLTPPGIYQQAMKALAALQQLNLAIPSECKIYHTQLAQIFKEYMGHKMGMALTNKTTGDTLLYFKEAGLSPAALTAISAALRGCDAVKFAKFMPDAAQSVQWYNDIKHVIEQTEKPQAVQS